MMNKKKYRIVHKFFISLVIVGIVFSNIPFYALNGLLDSIEKTSGIVDKIWQLEQGHNSEIVDKFTSIRDVAEKLKIKQAYAAISIRNTGAYTSGTTNLTPAIPAGAVAGDMMLLIYGTKPYNDAPTITAGWTNIGSATDGTVAAGVDVGSMQTRIYYKEHTGTESAPTVTNGTNNVSGAVIVAFQKSAGDVWETPVGAGGGDATAGTGFSVTASSNPGITVNDMLVGYAAIRSDAGTQSSISITATGATVGAFTEYPATDLATTAGGDMAMSGGYRLVTAGTASAAPVYTSTLAAAHTGSAFIVRLRATTPAATTTLSTGTNPGNATIAPGGAITSVNGFTLTTSAGTDAITAVTVNLSSNSGVGTLSITDSADTVLGSIGGGTGSGIITGSNSVSITSTNATTGGTAFKVKVTPLSHANMPAPDGGDYAITGAVTDWTGTNTKAGQASDTSSTVTIDNNSPATTTGASATPGDATVDVGWTAPGDTDYQQIYIYCKTSTILSGDTPAEGSDPAVDGTACGATAKLKYKGTVSPQTITGLTNNTLYYFRIYARDTNGNFTAYASTQEISATPVAPTFTTTVATTGTQTSTISIPTSNAFVGGAFTLTRSGGSANVTSMTVTVNNATGLSNMDLYTDTVASCTTADPAATATLFGTNATVGLTTTITGSVAVTTTARCFYVVVDVGSGAADAQTLDVSIASTTHVTVGTDTISGTPSIAGTTTLSVPSVIIAGTIYSDEVPTAYNCSTGNVTVRVAKNGVLAQSVLCTAAGGTYTLPGVTGAVAGDVFTIFIDDVTASKQASIVTKVNDGTTDLTLNLYQQRVIVRNENGVATTNANMGAYDSADNANIKFTESLGNLTIAAANKLIIWTGKTFTPGGTVTTTASATSGNPDGDITIQTGATLSMGTNALSVGGDFTNSGVFSYGVGQMMTFTATGTGHVIEDGTNNFDNVIFNGSGGGWRFNSDVVLAGDLTVTLGTLISFGQTTTVNGGDVTGNGVINMTGAGTFIVNNAGNFGGNTAWIFNVLTIGAAGNAITTATGTGSITIGNSFVIDTGDTLDAKGKDWIISDDSHFGNTFVINGTLDDSTNTSTFSFTGYNAGGDTTIPASTGYNNITIGHSSIVDNYTIGTGTLALSGNLTIGVNATLIGTGNITVAGNVAGDGGINLTGGTFEQRITSNKGFGTGMGVTPSWTFNNLIFSNSATDTSLSILASNTSPQNIIVTGNLQIGKSGDDATGPGSPTTLEAGGLTWTLSNTGTPMTILSSPQGALSATFATFNYTGLSPAVTPATYNNLTINGSGTATIGGTTVVGATMTVSSAVTNNSTLTVTGALSGASALTQGIGAVLNIGGTSGITTLTASASTNTVNYTGASQAVKATTYDSLTINGSGTATIGGATIVNSTMTATSAVTNNSTLTVTGALGGVSTLTNGATGILNIGFAGAPTITTLTATTSGNIVNYTAAIPNCKVTSYHHLNFTGSGAVTCAVTTIGGNLGLSGTVSWTTTSSINVSGTTTVGTGTSLTNGLGLTFASPTISITSTGSMTNNGTTTVNTALSGTGSFVNGATGTLNIGFATAPAITTLTTSASGNTVNYTAALPNCAVTSYHHLNFTGSGAITCAVTTVGGNLGLSTGTSMTWTTGGNLAVGGNLSVGNGVTLTQGAFTLTVTGNTVIGGGVSGSFVGSGSALGLNGDLTLALGSTWTKGAGTVTFGKSAAQVITDNTASKQDLGMVATANIGTSVSTATNVKLTLLNVALSTTFDISNDTLILTGSGTPLSVSGTFTTTGSTVEYSNALSPAIANITYNNLLISGTITAVSASATVGGVMTVSGTFSPNAGTMTLNNGLINNGTLAASGTHTFVFATANTAAIGGSAAATQFQNFSVSGIGAAKTLTFKHQTTNAPIFTFNGTVTLTGASTQLITINSDDGINQWLAHFNVAGNPTYVSVSNSGCDAGTLDMTVNETSTLGANNGSCWKVGATTTLGNGTDGGNSTIGPSISATEIDRFSLVTNSGTDTVTGMTVTLSPAGAFNNIATVDVQTTGGVSKCSLAPSSNTVLLTTCGIAVNTTSTEYKIMITPKTHTDMPVVPGASYTTTATVTSITATNITAGTDSSSATITIDNASPADVSSSTATRGSSLVNLAWINPIDSDFTTSGTVLALRRAGSAVADVPVEGVTYTVGNTIGTATVACVVTGSAPAINCQDSGLINGTTYYYKIFTRDSRGNYSAGVTPSGVPVTPVSYGGGSVGVSGGSSGGGTPVSGGGQSGGTVSGDGGSGGGGGVLPQTFTGVDGTTLIGYDSNWTLLNGNFGINTNAIFSNTAATDTMARWGGGAFNGNQYSQMVLNALSSGNYIGVAVRTQNGAHSGYGAYSDLNTNTKIVKWSTGTPTDLYTGAVFSPGDILRLEISGTSLTLKKNGATVTSVSDATFSSGMPGIVGKGNSTGSRGDNFYAGSMVSQGGGGVGEAP